MSFPRLVFARFARPCLALLLLGPALASPVPTPPTARIVPSPEPGWPQFRGPRRDGVSTERGLLPAWPAEGPRVLWKTEGLGRGYSSPIIVDGRIHLTGDAEGELRIRTLDLAGRPLWQASHGLAWRDPYPGARTTLTARGGFLYLLNAHGRLGCFDAATGQERWGVDVLLTEGGKNITWGISENVLVDDRAVYVTVGSASALVVAFDRLTGQRLWASPPLPVPAGENPAEGPSYVSPILVEHGTRRLLLGCSSRHLYCLDAADGAIQWTRPFPTTYSVISMVPALLGEAIFMTAPHGRGGQLFHLTAPAAPGQPFGARDGWKTSLDTLQGCVVQVGDKLIGSHYGARKGWAALDTRTGAVLYETSDYVKGAPLLADGRLYALCEDGWMLLLEAGEKQFHQHGRFRLAEAKRDAWAHPVILDGRLYLRYHDTLTCYDVSATGTP